MLGLLPARSEAGGAGMSAYYLMNEDQKPQGFDSLRNLARRLHILREGAPIELRSAWVEREAEPNGAAIAVRKITDAGTYGDLVAWAFVTVTPDCFERLRAALDATAPLKLVHSRKEG